MCFSVQVDMDLKALAKEFKASINQEAYKYFQEAQKRQPKQYKAITDDGKLFTKLWAPVVIHHKNQNEIRPMRYQLLPSFCKKDKYTRLNPKTNRDIEIKSTYNARIESLNDKKAWQIPFGRYHGVLSVKSFYEWVEDENGQKKILEFYAPNNEKLNLACLFDTWYSADKTDIIQSFAIITRPPEPEVLAAGHDRTPVNLKTENIDKWLNPKILEKKELLTILNEPERPGYLHQPA
jgi:putative SOS response-associated peptidase YedK